MNMTSDPNGGLLGHVERVRGPPFPFDCVRDGSGMYERLLPCVKHGHCKPFDHQLSSSFLFQPDHDFCCLLRQYGGNDQ